MSTATLAMPIDPTTRRIAAPAGIDRIVLTGFMGSGKTTTGSLLANQLGWRFLDLDHEIELRHNRAVPQIFAESGEPYFRRIETAALAALMGQRNAVIALGGGAPEELGNRLLLEQTPRTAVVYLAAPLDVLLERCRIQGQLPGATDRPVLADLNLATSRFAQRRPHYERIAAHTVDTSPLSLSETVGVILTLLSS